MCRTDEGEAVWDVISTCGTQQRLVPVPTPDGGGMMLKPVGLDFGAIMLVGAGLGVDLRLLAAVLPDVEVAILTPAEDDPADDCLEDDA